MGSGKEVDENLIADMREKIYTSRDKRELMLFLRKNYDQELKTFNIPMISEWGRKKVGKYFRAESTWVHDMVTVGYARNVGEARNGLFELTEEGLSTAMDFADESIENVEAILGIAKVHALGAPSYDTTIFGANGSNRHSGKVTRDLGSDGWSGYNNS